MSVKDGACHSSENESETSPPSKKMKLDKSPELKNCLIYIVEKKISSGHLSLLKEIANKKGFPIADSIKFVKY